MKKPRSWKSRLGAGKLEQACEPVDGFILVAEDDDDQFFLLSLALEKARIANPLLRARNGQDALDYIEGTSPCPARTEPAIPVLALLDLHMPVMDGLDVLAAINSRPEPPKIPVVVLSSFADSLTLELARRLGAKDCRIKPLDFSDLVRLVAEICSRWLGVGPEETQSHTRPVVSRPCELV